MPASTVTVRVADLDDAVELLRREQRARSVRNAAERVLCSERAYARSSRDELLRFLDGLRCDDAGGRVGDVPGPVLRQASRLHHSSERTIVNLMVQYPTTVDRAFAALADPTRRAVLERLGSGRATISELAEPFGMSLTGMKKHIRLLEEAELVTTEKVGRVRRCMLAPYAFEGISTWLQRLDRFAQVVERTKGDTMSTTEEGQADPPRAPRRTRDSRPRKRPR